MTAYVFSAVDGTRIPFGHVTHTLHFDDPTIQPADLRLNGVIEGLFVNAGPPWQDGVHLRYADLEKLGTERFTFAGGGIAIFGDGETTTADDAAGTFHVGTDFGDLFFGLGGDDTHLGGAGDDLFLLSGVGHDSIDGGPGMDEVRCPRNGAAIVDLGEGTMSLGASTAVLAGIENVRGTRSSDDITGSAAANLLRGGDYHDSVSGLDGNDTLAGNDHADTLSGGAGDDRLDGGNESDFLRGGSGSDLLIGGAAPYYGYPNSDNDSLDGGAGDDRLIGRRDSLSSDSVIYEADPSGVIVNLKTGLASDGFGGSDILRDIRHIFGSAFDDSLIGSNGYNAIRAGAGDDTVRGGGTFDSLIGGDGNDALHGERGNDGLYGYAGDDTMWGGPGNDVLVGSGYYHETGETPGRDVFVFASMGHGSDRIVAFDASTDTAGDGDASVDTLDFRHLFDSIGYAGSDPVSDGYMKIEDLPNGYTKISIDPDGGADAWTAIVRIQGISASVLLGNPDFFLFQ